MSSGRSFNPSFKKVLSSRDQAVICCHGNATSTDAPEQLQDRSHELQFEGRGTDRGSARWILFIYFVYGMPVQMFCWIFTDSSSHNRRHGLLTHGALQPFPLCQTSSSAKTVKYSVDCLFTVKKTFKRSNCVGVQLFIQRVSNVAIGSKQLRHKHIPSPTLIGKPQQ